MYFIVGKTINQNKQIISYLITDGNSVREVTSRQVFVEYRNNNLPYLKSFNTATDEVDFKNIDNSLIPTFYNGRGINNNVSVLKIITDNNSQIGVRILVASGEIMNVSLPDILKLVSSNKMKLFNAKIVNNKVVMKYAGETVTETSRGSKEEVTINNYDKSKFVIDDNLTLIEYTGNDKEVIIPEGVTSIAQHAFCGCKSFTSIIIPSGVTSIGIGAFYKCMNLTSITISDSVTSIDNHAFRYCTGLTSIKIPDSVVSIGNYAFSGCTNLTSIIIPDSVIDIGWGAFENCTNLTSIRLPDGVTNIGDFEFSNCTNLTSINIPNSVTSIGVAAFVNCLNLKSITIPDSVTSIGREAFCKCTSLKSITIPDSVIVIGAEAFKYWTSSQIVYMKGRSFAPSEWD